VRFRGSSINCKPRSIHFAASAAGIDLKEVGAARRACRGSTVNAEDTASATQSLPAKAPPQIRFDPRQAGGEGGQKGSLRATASGYDFACDAIRRLRG
jgi:hypothetical protein